MDYGPDYPPTVSDQETVPPEPEPLRLWQKLAATAILYAIIWAAGALLLHARMSGDVTYWTPEPPARGHGTHVTTSLPPLPHMARTPRNAHP